MIRRQLEAIQATPESNRYMTERGIEVFNRLAKECFQADNKRLDKNSIIDLRVEHKLPIPLGEDYWTTENERSHQTWIELSHETSSTIMHKGIYYRPLCPEEQNNNDSSHKNMIEILDITAGRNSLTMMRITHIDISNIDVGELPLDDIARKVVLNGNEYFRTAELTYSYNTLYPVTTNDMRLSREQLEKALAAIGTPRGFDLNEFLNFPESNRSLSKLERE